MPSFLWESWVIYLCTQIPTIIGCYNSLASGPSIWDICISNQYFSSGCVLYITLYVISGTAIQYFWRAICNYLNTLNSVLTHYIQDLVHSDWSFGNVGYMEWNWQELNLYHVFPKHRLTIHLWNFTMFEILHSPNYFSLLTSQLYCINWHTARNKVCYFIYKPTGITHIYNTDVKK